MFNLINSQVYELQQQESLLLFEKQQNHQQQQIQLQQFNLHKIKNNKKNNNNNNCNNTITTNIDTYSNNNNNITNGIYNCKSLNNLTNYLNINSNHNNNNNNNNNSNSNSNNNNTNNGKNNSDTINRKKKSNYGSYYRQEKLKATANFIEKFLKSETTSSIATATKEQQQRQKMQQQQQQQQHQQKQHHQKDEEENYNDENKHICYTPTVNFTYTYQKLDPDYPGDKNTKNNSINNDHYTNNNDRLKFNCNNNNNNDVGLFNGINNDDILDINSDITGELGQPNSLQLEHLNNLLDKNSSDTMPSLSPSQSSTDQSTSTQTTTATISSNNNSLSSNGSNVGVNGIRPEIKIKRILKKSSFNINDDHTTQSSTTATTAQSTTDRTIKKSTNNTLNTVLHRKKLLQVVSFLDQQNQRLEKELQNEKVQRNEELSRIVKSLLYFEAKLKSEKKVINQKLYDKDDEIARLIRMNRSLKEKLNEKEARKAEAQREAETEGRDGVGKIADDSSKVPDQLDDQLECKYPESLYCSNCRKEYYGLNEKCDNWTQTSGKITDCRSNLKGENNNNNNNQINNNSTEHCSSSDETLSSSFYGARRSVRYTSKRTFGTFREYMRSRCMNIDDTNIDTNHNLSEDEQRSTLSRDEYPSHSSSNTSNSYNKKDKKTFSSKMERLHGVKRQSSFEFDSSEAEMRYYRKNFSSSGPETDVEHTNSPNDEGIEEDDDENDYDEDDIDDYDDNHLGNDIYRGVNVGVLTTTPLQSPTTTSATVNSKEFSETSVKQDFETSTDDWYASASDADDDQNSTVCRTKSYGYNAVNPVLECVNQILLQQSMEECINEKTSGGGSGGGSVGSGSIRENHYDNSCNGPMSLESNDNIQTGNFSVCSGGSGSKDTHTNSNLSNGSNSGGGSRKRVHFSTKNSMVHVPRDDDDITEHKSCSFSDTITSSIQSEHHSNNLNYESIYSNEYEPIGSENNSSNLYVDMESKLDPDERINSTKSKQQNHHNHQQHQHQQQQQQQSQNKQPPALPPKPANLIKFKRVNKMQQPTASILSHRNSIDLTQMHSAGADSSEQQPPSAKLTKELLEKIDCDKSEKYGSEPDYCSISEVNVAIKTMQIVADVHKSNDTNSSSSVVSILSGDNSDAMSQKTSDETEEIFADVPKLPNVAAIIAPSPKNKSPKCNKDTLNKNDSGFIQSSISLQLQQQNQLHNPQHQQQRPQTLQLYRPKSPGQVQRKHVPNILAEINKKIQQANITSASLSPTSPNKINSNFNLLANHQAKRKPTTNQLLPILKSSTSSTSNVGSCIINSKNFNNILLSTQTINNPICKSLKNCDTIKLNQQQNQQKISSPTNLKQQQFLNQMQSNSTAKLLHNKNKQNQLLQHNQHHQQHPLAKIEDSSLEAEFDWYNLDAEYGKSTTNRPDIVKAADVLNSCLDEYILTNSSRADRLANDINQSIEYNLDEEFSLSNQPDIIKENLRSVDDRKLETIPGSESESNESSLSTSSKNLILDQYHNQRKAIDELQPQQHPQSDDPESCSDENVDPSELKELNLSLDNKTNTKDTKTLNDNNTLTVVNKFPTICDQTPGRKTVNIKQKNFVEFIDSAGLSTKSLPQQKKIYFTGPFV